MLATNVVIWALALTATWQEEKAMFYGGAFERLGDASLNANVSASAARASTQAQQATSAMKDVQFEIDRLKLMNQALWELLKVHTGITEEQLAAKVKEVDLRDGSEDGRMTHQALQCPNCGRVSSSKHYKCLYCGLLFEKPTFG